MYIARAHWTPGIIEQDNRPYGPQRLLQTMLENGMEEKPATDSRAADCSIASCSSAESSVYFGATEDLVTSLQFSETLKHILKYFAE